MAGDDLKDRILAEIAAHVRVYGRERWEMIRENPAYSAVIGKEAGEAGRRKFYRWVNSVCGGVPDPLGGQGGHPFDQSTVAAAGASIEDGKKRALLAAQKNIPAAPSPAYLARRGAAADNSINFLAQIGIVFHDIEMLRAKATKVEEDGEERILNPHLFGEQIKHRLRTMDTALRVMQEVWDLKYQQEFYDAIVSIIVEEMAPYPEAQERAVKRLAELNKRRGMTLHAEPI